MIESVNLQVDNENRNRVRVESRGDFEVAEVGAGRRLVLVGPAQMKQDGISTPSQVGDNVEDNW